ncbi:heparan-alpha-glucosaminide N-acetyltransferase domain-containing protein [Chitinophaga cymbidii]|uniref:DUF5009 domain-containing protein n=1 Tax=Chitinophaga cymbidii TaxID=1096750 RepID=A0A512RQG9_9BACT|nr:DUF5009 domain-containing protein [Chitinophaga cymbidii]GEP97944.1 hypothetical protein CCY01nite_42040 [Chitinophaga cymbidii]
MTTPQRIAAIDITRALTMLLMIFVNDLWSLHDIPDWLEHTAADEDGMGLADTVFPAFLFIVGMSIPYAIANRIKKGDTVPQLLRHVLERSVALLVMGLFLVNGENLNAAATGIPRGAWNIICCLSFIFIWNQYPKTWPPVVKNIIRGLGIATLLVMAWICRCGEGAEITRFATHWWGILGLIGWAYLVSALVFVLGKRRFGVNVTAWLLCLALSMATHAQLLAYPEWLAVMLGPVEYGAMPALVLGGVVVSQIFRHYSAQGRWKPVMGVLMGLCVILLTAGLLTRPVFEISKIRATPSWVLICSAITIALFVFTCWLGDMRRKAHWFKVIRPAGTDTLLCYLIPYFAYGIMSMTGFHFPHAILGGGMGIIKSLLFAVLMIQIAGLISRSGIRLKL